MWSKYRKKYNYSLILLEELVRTDFKLRYQGSVLGYVWSFLKPLFLFVILYFVFVVFLRVGEDMPNWPVGLLVGIVLWNFFSEITNMGISSIVGRGDLIRKINFPKYIIILASSLSALINLVLNMLIIFMFIFLSGIDLSWSALMAPLYILEIFLFGLGLAFLLSAVFVRYRDVNFIWEIIMQGLFYASVVIYPLSMVLNTHPKIATLLMLNPVAQSIQDVRHVLVNSKYPTLSSLEGWAISMVPIVITTVVLVFGMWYFRRRSPTFAEDV